MSSKIFLAGGTGAHIGAAFTRLHILGHALGYFERSGKPIPLPGMYLVDRDDGPHPDTEENGTETAAQVVGRLLVHHPGRHHWPEPAELRTISPAPIGPDPKNPWFELKPSLGERFEGDPLLPLVAQDWQQGIRYDRGMFGSPAIGSSLFALKRLEPLDHDLAYRHAREMTGVDRAVVVGSGVGGTGASAGPTIAQELAAMRIGGGARKLSVMAVMLLNWFRFTADERTREKSAAREHILERNAHSAMQYYGASLGDTVATTPVAIPRDRWVERAYEEDLHQSVAEYYPHAVCAIAAWHHVCHQDGGYAPGVYAIGAVDSGGVDPKTAIPGGTLQDLAHRATTLTTLLRAWSAQLGAHHDSVEVTPTVVNLVRAQRADANLVAGVLDEHLRVLEEQLAWLERVLGVRGRKASVFRGEMSVQERAATHPLQLRAASGEELATSVANALLDWTSAWVRDTANHAARGQELVVPPHPDSKGVYWEKAGDQGGEGVQVRGRVPGVPHPQESGLADVFRGVVNERRVWVNGWPHPFAAADHFRWALKEQHPTAVWQHRLLLLGLVAGKLRLEATEVPLRGDADLSLGWLLTRATVGRDPTGRSPGPGGHRIVDEDGTAYGFSSPHTLVAPVPYLHSSDPDEQAVEGSLFANAATRDAWASLLERVTGLEAVLWDRVVDSPSAFACGVWTKGLVEAGAAHRWIAGLNKRFGQGMSPPWTKSFVAFEAHAPGIVTETDQSLVVLWSEDPGTVPGRGAVEVMIPSPHSVITHGDPPEQLLDWAAMEARWPGLGSAIDQHASDTEEFTSFTFRWTGDTGEVRAVWDAHVRALLASGHLDGVRIVGAGGDRPGRLCVARHDEAAGSAVWAMVPDTVVVELAHVCPPTVAAIGQRSWSDPEAMSAIRLPDLPVRVEYLDVVADPVQADGGVRLTDSLRGQESEAAMRRIAAAATAVVSTAAGEPTAQWQVRWRGRTGARSVVRAVQRLGGKTPVTHPDRADVGARSLGAHLLVWPDFKVCTSETAPRWKTYYTYQAFTYHDGPTPQNAPGWGARLLWQKATAGNEGSALEVSRPLESMRQVPVRFGAVGAGGGAGASACHLGGPPLAFEVLHDGTGCGLLFARLRSVTPSTQEATLGVDFGTSHSVAAVRTGSEAPSILDLGPIRPGQRQEEHRRGLTLEVSTDGRHATGPDSPSSQGTWLPQYGPETDDGDASLPSELATFQPLAPALLRRMSTWEPGIDFAVPSKSFLGSALGHTHRVADFKWEASRADLRGKEPILREIYVSQVLEMALAQLIGRAGGAFPEGRTSARFLWSLRSSDDEIDAFSATVENALSRVQKGTGVTLVLEGFLDESRAASKPPAAGKGEIVLVADLGGGTLDLFLTTAEAHQDPIARPHSVADSFRLGGNLLMEQLASLRQRALPGGWGTFDGACTQLATWARVQKLHELFRESRSDKVAVGNVRGYKPQEIGRANLARGIRARYFELIVDLLARYLAAYLRSAANKGSRGSGTANIELRFTGNGWRLHPRAGVADMGRTWSDLKDKVEARVKELVEGDRGAEDGLEAVPSGDGSPPGSGSPGGQSGPSLNISVAGAERDLKAAPVLRLVGAGVAPQVPREVASASRTHLLFDLNRVLVQQNYEVEVVPWTTAAPFEEATATLIDEGRMRAALELGDATPPIVMPAGEIQELGEDLRDELQTHMSALPLIEGGMIRPRVGRLVYEGVYGHARTGHRGHAHFRMGLDPSDHDVNSIDQS